MHKCIRFSSAVFLLVIGLSFSTLAGTAWAAKETRQGPDLVVVELFTSQSCSSCPPADKFLGELAKHKNVLALSMHVDYWNALGWRDPWSSPKVTERQRRYSKALGTRYVSTPQAIIQGRAYAVGSDRTTVTREIEKARRSTPARVQPRVTMPGPNKLTVKLPGGNPGTNATVWLVAFDDGHTASISGGENTGATITYTNVVRELRPIGSWRGKPASIDIDISKEQAAGYGNCAVIIQAQGTGAILGALSLPMRAGSR
jgi:hypothetical protein